MTDHTDRLQSKDVHPDAKRIAELWVDNFTKPTGPFEAINQKLKLQSDIMIFAQKYHQEEMKK